MTLRSRATLPSDGFALLDDPNQIAADRQSGPSLRPGLTVLIAVPTIEVGAADEGAVDLAMMLADAGHHPIVVSNGGRLEAELAGAGIETIRLNMASRNPAVIVRNAARLVKLMSARKCDVVHAHGRAAAWSAYLAARAARVPFLTSWYKGFRQQNAFKRAYNGVMARGDRIIAVSEQIADLIVKRHRTPRERIAIIPASVDFDRFDPGALTVERMNAVRDVWGVAADTQVILVADRMLRRKGHHVVVHAARRLKRMGAKDFLFVFAGEDHGRSRYTGELWDLVLSTGTADVIRMARPIADPPAAYGAAVAVVSAALQPEGVQRAILEGLAMARPMIVSDDAAGPDIVLTPPAVPEDRITGLRVPSGDDQALALAVARLFAMPEPVRRAIGRRGREWALAHCGRSRIAEQTLAVYAAVLPAPAAVA